MTMHRPAWRDGQPDMRLRSGDLCAAPWAPSCCQPIGHATKMAWRPAERRLQLNQAGAWDVHVRPATRADAPGIVRVSNSSILPGEDAGFGAGMDSPFRDTSMLLSAWRDPNLVQGEEVLVAEMDGRIVGCVTVETKDANSSWSASTFRASFRAEGSARCWCGQSKSEPEQQESRQSPPAPA